MAGAFYAMNGQNPEFSVIVVVNNNISDEEVLRCLATFVPQEGDVSFEFIVVDQENEKRREVFQSRFPWVTLLTVEKMATGSYPRNLALRRARGEYVVFLEDHVTVCRDHLLRLREAFQKGCDAVGGSVTNGCPESLGAWLQYFCQYHQWLPCRPSGEITDLPGCNFAYRTSTLKRLGSFVESRFKIESLYNVQAKKQGVRFCFAPGAVAVHYNYDAKTVLQFWRFHFLYGLDFASHRGFSFTKSLVYGLGAGFLPGIAYARIYQDVRPDRELLKRFFKMTPVLLFTLAIWATGEMCGYLSSCWSRTKHR